MNTDKQRFKMSHHLFARFALAVLLLSAGLRVMAQSEEGVKAAFIYNFAKFTVWPASAFADASTKLAVGFVGASSLADTFEKNVAGKDANGRQFAIKKLDAGAGAEACHIVVIGDDAKAASVVDALKGKPILTVGEGEGFGGVVGFVKEGAKVLFNLNLEPAKASGLTLDSKLQKVAKSVKGG